MMSAKWLAYRLPTQDRDRLGLATDVVPVRRTRAKKVFAKDRVNGQLLVEELDAALAADPALPPGLAAETARAALTAANGLVSAGDVDGAAALYAIGLRHAGADVDLRIDIARAIFATGQRDAALAIARQVLVVDADHADAKACVREWDGSAEGAPRERAAKGHVPAATNPKGPGTSVARPTPQRKQGADACSACGGALTPGAKFCIDCGSAICGECGAAGARDAKFCIGCGARRA